MKMGRSYLFSILVFSAFFERVVNLNISVGLFALGNVSEESQTFQLNVFSRLMYQALQVTLDGLNGPAHSYYQDSLQPPRTNNTYSIVVSPESGYTDSQLSGQLQYLLQSGNVSAAFGPFSVTAHDAVGNGISAYGLPLVTVAYVDPASPFRQTRSRSAPTTLSAWGHSEYVTSALVSVLSHYNWTEVAVVTEPYWPWEQLRGDFTGQLDLSNINYTTFEVDRSRPYVPQLRGVSSCCRIVVLLGGAKIYNTTGFLIGPDWWAWLADIMTAADELGMTNGDYVFVVPSLVSSCVWNLDAHFPRPFSQSIFRPMLILVIDAYEDSTDSNHFLEEVERRAFGVEGVTSQNVQHLLSTPLLHDAVWIYVDSLERALADGGTHQDAVSYFPGVNLTGLTGRLMVDSNLNRLPHFRLIGLSGTSTVYTRVANLVPETTPTTSFLLSTLPFIWANGLMTPPPAIPECGFEYEKCVVHYSLPIVAIIVPVVLTFTLVLIVVIVLAYMIKRHQYNNELMLMAWNIDPQDIQINPPKPFHPENEYMEFIRPGFQPKKDWYHFGASVDQYLKDLSSLPSKGRYKNQNVVLDAVYKKQLVMTRPLLVELKQMHELAYKRFVKFFGILIEPNVSYIIKEDCPLGSLSSILLDPSKKLDNSFKNSFALDIIKGLEYIQSSFLGSHGNLTSKNIYIDNHWVAKLSGMGFWILNSEQYHIEEKSERDLFWTAPELLRTKSRHPRGTPSGDIYSYAMILVEIFNRTQLYSEQVQTHDVIIQRLKSGTHPVLRPSVSADKCDMKWLEIIEACWNEVPAQRPVVNGVSKAVQKLAKLKKGNIADHMLGLMERYACNLEEAIEEQTLVLAKEKARTEGLVYRLLPKQVANQLKQGYPVTAEHFSCVTVYFSDIVGFTSICSRSTAFQVVDMLNGLYTKFDQIISDYDIYKVETIGDAYMLVSGLPVRNGTRHSVEVCDAALEILELTRQYDVKHMPETQIKIRIGIHSGPCLAGVVGVTMPRYCLFGETVLVASKMESSGEPMNIQISESTKELLDIYDEYSISLRGVSEYNRVGRVTTYWLNGKRQATSCSIRSGSKSTRQSPIGAEWSGDFEATPSPLPPGGVDGPVKPLRNGPMLSLPGTNPSTLPGALPKVVTPSFNMPKNLPRAPTIKDGELSAVSSQVSYY